MEKMYSEKSEELGCLDNKATLAEDPKTLAEEFLEAHYEFRRNILRGVVEYRKLEGEDSQWEVLSQEALNSICFRSMREFGDEVDVKADIKLYVQSEEPQRYDPIKDWLMALPKWDGQERVVDFWKRIPGITAQQIYFLSIYLRAVVAHWLGMNTEHGNECVPVLIGNQGCGKSTFCVRMLPPELRDYYLDHFNLANKFDKEMALTNCLLICLDEMDQYKAGQMAELKQALSKVKVNARQIYGKTIKVRQRYASFIGTTNNRHPLMDATGSRRYICIDIPKDEYIDNESVIEYEQLFAQVLYELQVKQEKYWFNNEEVKQIQKQNMPYEQVVDLSQMIGCCFHKAEDDELAMGVTTEDIRKALIQEFPKTPIAQFSSEKIGRALKNMDLQKKKTKRGGIYMLVPGAA